MARIRLRLVTALPLFVLLPASIVHGKEVRVATVEELRAAITAAAAGDHVVVADGAYEVDKAIEITVAGTKGEPIEIAAETVGGVEIKGAAGFTFRPRRLRAIARLQTDAPGRGCGTARGNAPLPGDAKRVRARCAGPFART